MTDGLVTRLRAAGCVFAEDEAAVLQEAARDAGHLERMTRARESGEPLEYVVGWARFRGLRVAVGPPVFVPRRRTELLVIEAVRTLPPGGLAVDLCCGAAPVGLAIRAERPDVRLIAVDIDPDAVRWARANLADAGEVVEGDLYDALPVGLRGNVDLLVVNAPYVPTAEIALMPPEAREHEARVALDGGDDGLDLHRRIADGAPGWLAPHGTVLIETSEYQADRTAAAFLASGLEPEIIRDLDLGATVVCAARAGQGRTGEAAAPRHH